MAETPEQRRLRLQFRNAGGGFEAAPLPRAVVSEIPAAAQDLGTVPAERQLRRGESGLGDPTQDSRTRIRTNEQFRNQPTQGDLFGGRPQTERAGLGERSKEALKRAERFTASPGTITREALQSQARPRAVGGVLAAGLGASTTAMNAANVYDQSGGDVGQTARQVAFDLPPAIGGTLGAVAGGALGRRSPAAAGAGLLAGGALGDTGGRQIASGISRLAGGSGLSPLEELQAGNEQTADNTVFVSPTNPDIPMLPEYGGVAVDARTGQPLGGQPAAAPAAVPGQEVAATQEAAPPAPVTPQQQQVQTGAPLGGNGYGAVPGIAGVVGRQGEGGVPEFTNAPDAVAGAQGEFTAGGRLGDGVGGASFAQEGDAALASQRFGRANELRRQYRTEDQQARAMGDQRRMQQTMQINANRAEYLLRSGRPNDRREANLLMAQNEQLAAQANQLGQTAQQIGLGLENADVQRERTAALDSGIRAQTALGRQQLAQEREARAGTKDQTASREKIAADNAATFQERVEGLFSQRDPATGDTGVPPETMALLTERAPVYAEQREAAFRESIAALRARAKQGDAGAAAQLTQAESDYDRFVQDVYSVDSEGDPTELRPVRKWDENAADQFFVDVRGQQQLQQDRSTSLPELGGALAGAAAGAARTPGGVVPRAVGALAGGALGALGGSAAESVVRGQQTRVPQGGRGASPTIAANTNRVYTSRGNVISTLSDGSTINLRDLMYNAEGDRTTANAPIIQAQFDALVAQTRSNDPTARLEAEQAMEIFSTDDDLRATLTKQQRARLTSRQGLGE